MYIKQYTVGQYVAASATRLPSHCNSAIRWPKTQNRRVGSALNTTAHKRCLVETNYGHPYSRIAPHPGRRAAECGATCALLSGFRMTSLHDVSTCGCRAQRFANAIRLRRHDAVVTPCIFSHQLLAVLQSTISYKETRT